MTILGVRSHKQLLLFIVALAARKDKKQNTHTPQRWNIWASPCFHEKLQTWTWKTISDGGERESQTWPGSWIGPPGAGDCLRVPPSGWIWNGGGASPRRRPARRKRAGRTQLQPLPPTPTPVPNPATGSWGAPSTPGRGSGPRGKSANRNGSSHDFDNFLGVGGGG